MNCLPETIKSPGNCRTFLKTSLPEDLLQASIDQFRSSKRFTFRKIAPAPLIVGTSRQPPPTANWDRILLRSLHRDDWTQRFFRIFYNVMDSVSQLVHSIIIAAHALLHQNRGHIGHVAVSCILFGQRRELPSHGQFSRAGSGSPRKSRWR